MATIEEGLIGNWQGELSTMRSRFDYLAIELRV